MATLNYMNKQASCMDTSRAFPWYLFSREFVTKIGCCIVLINHIHPYQNGNHINRRELYCSTDTFHFPCPIELFNNFMFEIIQMEMFKISCNRTIFSIRISLEILQHVFQPNFMNYPHYTLSYILINYIKFKVLFHRNFLWKFLTNILLEKFLIILPYHFFVA